MKFTESYWHGQIQKAISWKQKKSCQSEWKRYEDYYNHKFDNRQLPHFNLIYMLASSLMPSLVYQNPHIVNTPRRSDYAVWARFFDGIDNLLVSEAEVKTVIEDAVLHAFLHNVVGVEVGYDFVPEGKKEFDHVEGSLDRTRKYGQPWIEFIPARKLLFAPGTKDSRNCWWYAKNVMVNLETLTGVNGLKNLEPTHIPDEVKTEGDESIDALDPDRKYINMWIVHEAETHKWFWISSNGKFVLPPQDDPLQLDGLPMEPLVFNKGSDSIWGTPDCAYIESQQIEGDESRRDGRLQSRGASVKAFYDTNLLDENDIARFLTSDALGCIPVEVPADKKLSDVIQLVQPHVQMERFQYQKELLNDAQLLTGNGPNQLGTFAPGRRTKFETQVVEDRHVLRTGQRRERIAEVVGRMFTIVNKLIIKHWKAPTIAKVIGADAAVYYVQASPAELQNMNVELCTTVNVESLAPVSRERRKQEMYEVMNSIAKLAPYLGQVNLFPILQSFLSQFDWVDITKVLPMAQQQGGPVPIQQFQEQQSQVQTQPNYMNQLQANLANMQGLAQRYPNGGQTQTEGQD